MRGSEQAILAAKVSMRLPLSAFRVDMRRIRQLEVVDHLYRI